MKSKINREYVLRLLERLLLTPSPSGYCHPIMKVVAEEAGRLGLSVSYTNKGGGVITVPGRQEGRVVGLSGHVDTLGAMVRSIKKDGALRFTSVGGFMMGAVENEYCLVHTRDGRVYEGTILTTKPSVHVYPDARELKREEAVMEIRLDERVSSEEEVKQLGIGVGDFISFDPRTRFLSSGYIKSRHLDDKAGVAALFGMLELLRRENIAPAYSLKLFISTYEEVGHGAAYLPPEIDELLAVDMGAMGEDLSCAEHDVSICAKDSSGPYDYHMTTKLIELAKRDGLGYAVDIYPQYGSDASAALRGGSNIRAALIGPGVHASHGMERTHGDALWNTIALLTAYVTET
ncbi:M42 family metallopeptidase [Paenibacillus doosanensis]|uniref:Aminopeptidase YpdE n=1 Tax=Paenibacillus konkukensis TaxID=2020716 RepID=A0ABY4RJ68_9BACL|nr:MULTISPECIES: M42 family metallopeptidase [Paenibacillus]MCS7461117.1 M42 family metallopeptidase [Paenibacillus doosanensis]UQZ81613.1 Aminopeptidase YpdE [Paenibacillus konkukensis]